MKLSRVILISMFITIIECIVNCAFLNNIWQNHYNANKWFLPEFLLSFSLWFILSFYFTIAIYIITIKFSFLYAISLSWICIFILIKWFVLLDLEIFPSKALPLNIFSSLFEVVVAILIIKIMKRKEDTLF